MSKKLINHPAIEEVETEAASASDYKYFVHLKKGWSFRGYGGRTKGFHTVKSCLSYIERDPQSEEEAAALPGCTE